MEVEITSVDPIPLKRTLDDRFANAQKWIDAREYCLVRIESSDGSVGWGECWGPIAGNHELLDEQIGPWLIGQDPREVERIHDDLVFRLRSAFHSYVPASVVSGVDIALWDLRGKIAGEPVGRLLGGQRRHSVRAYATGHFFSDCETFSTLRDRVVKEARANVDAGFDALKNKIGLGRHFPWGRNEDVELVRAIREAVGDDVRLMTDANHAYDVPDARWVGDRLSELDVYFFEEPLSPEQFDAYATVNETVDVSLAAGESWAFEHEFDRAVTTGAVDFLQPDVTSAGGITSTRRVADTAAANGLRCIPHVFGTPIALAASLHVLATLPGDPMLEFDRTPNPIRKRLTANPITNDGNRVPIPEGPGLGIEVNTDTVTEFRV